MGERSWLLLGAQVDDPTADTGQGPQVVLFCGSLINRPGLCDRLSLPASTSPGVVAAALYAQVGLLETARALEGSGSFILWDEERRQLALAADRMGLNPLYYASHNGQCLVSSDIEEILSQLPARTLSLEMIAAHLVGFPRPPGRTFFKDVLQVEPGAVQVWTGTRLERRVYWCPGDIQRLDLSCDAEYEAHVQTRLRLVHREWLQSFDGDIATTLSSGIDSGVVVATTRQLCPSRRIDSFSWVFPKIPEADESPGIEEMVARFRLNPNFIQADRFWTMRHARGIRNPSFAPNAHPYAEAWEETFRQVAARGHGSLLTGSGGDELFGGLSSYPELLLSLKLISLARQLSRDLSLRPPSLGAARHLFRVSLDPILRSFPAWQRRRDTLPDWLTPEIRGRVLALVPSPLPMKGVELVRRVRLRLLENLPGASQISRVQSLATPFGIELIHPLLDRRLVELAAALPSDQTFREGKDKSVLRRAYRESLPSETLQRVKKVVPKALFDKGFRRKESAKVDSLLHDMRSAQLGLVDQDRVRRSYSDYLEGRSSGVHLWNLVTLESWLRDSI